MSASEQYNWKRFWRRRDGRVVLDQGYVPDPEDTRGFRLNPDVVAFEEIAVRPCLILLGEPGIGKSTAMQAVQRTARSRLAEGEAFLAVDLGAKREPRRDLFDQPSFRAWQQGRSALHLFLDSLDECPDTGIGPRLVDELRDGPIESLRLRLACRTAELPRVIENKLPLLWQGKDDVGFYEMVALRRRDVAEAAGAHADAFLAEIARQGAESLAIKPITLTFLLKLFRTHQALPTTRHELYRDGCRVLCEESSDQRIDLHDVGRLSAHQRLAVAARIAAVCVFARRGIVWRNIDLGDLPDDAIIPEDLCGGVERVQRGELKVTAEVLRETLSMTRLFSSRGPGQLGWAHQTYPEFLAAYFLEQRGLTVDQMMEVISHPGERTRIAPELRETAAWLASMRPEIFRKILETDPLVLLRSDGAMMDDVTREQLVGGLLDRVERREIGDLAFTHGPDVRKLDHPRLAVQLEPYIRDRGKQFATRRAAMAIAEECRVTALQHVVADVALDASYDTGIRAVAANAVAVLGDDATMARMLPLASHQGIDDPNDELRGHALLALWPKLMTRAQLFAALTKPKTPLYCGAYYRFLKQPIEQHLDVTDLPAALAWAGSYPSSDPYPSQFSGLPERIMRKAWHHLDDQPTLRAFVQVVGKRLEEDEPVFYAGNCTENFGEEPGVLLGDHERRRVLVSAIIVATPGLSHEASALIQSGLLRMDDISWVVQCLKDAADTAQQVRWSRLVNELWFNSGHDAQVSELVLGAAEQSVVLQEILGPGFVDIHSPEAARARERYLRAKEIVRRREEPPTAEPPDVHVRNCLDRFDAGDLSAWWSLHQEIASSPAAHHCDGEVYARARALADWIAADEPTRARIVAGAKRYLSRCGADSDEWIRTNEFYPPAAAGYSSLRLLLWLNAAEVVVLPREVWRHWAPVVLAFSMVAGPGEDDVESHRRLMRVAYQKAPEEFLWTLGILIHKDNQRYDSIFIVEELRSCWDERLGALLLAKATDPCLKPGCLRSLLEELLKHNVPGAQQLALSFLQVLVPLEGTARARASAAAEALLPRAVEVCWPALREIWMNDHSFVSDVFLGVASRMYSGHLAGTWAARLSEDDEAELYLWLMREFPPEQDPPERFDGADCAAGPRDTIAEMRDALLHHIAGRGTEASRNAIERIKEVFPEVPGVGSASILALETTLQQTWRPLDPDQILALRPRSSTKRLTSTPMTSHTPSTSASSGDSPLFSWIHISDIHIGHGAHAHRHDQQRVLAAMADDITNAITKEHLPVPDALLITGDVAFSATPEQYTTAADWLAKVVAAAQLGPSQVLIVPGNHDVDWNVDKVPAVNRLLWMLHEGKWELDTALADTGDREQLAQRFGPFHRFARQCAPTCYPGMVNDSISLLGWSHRQEARGGLVVRLLGFNTALLSASGDDRGRLRLSEEALTKRLETIEKGELVIALSHHPLRDGWLEREHERDARAWLRREAHIHLCGHVHRSDSEETRRGSGGPFVEITAGAVHEERQPAGVPAGHAYNFAAVVPGSSPGSLAVRIWERRFSDKNKQFYAHTEDAKESCLYAERDLRLVLPVKA